MNFIYNNKNYNAPTAVEIVRAIERDTEEYSCSGEHIRDFLDWSLARFSDQIHSRELVTSTHVSEEALALNYLCLLDEHRLGSFSETRKTPI
jgi:hypothetical protein